MASMSTPSGLACACVFITFRMGRIPGSAGVLAAAGESSPRPAR